MFPKFNLSRLSGFAALGLVVAVLGGCAETTSGTGLTLPDSVARTEITRAQSEIPVQHTVGPVAPAEAIAQSHKLASHRPVQGSALH